MHQIGGSRKKSFSLGQILSVATVVLFCSMEELQEIIDYMANFHVMSHELPTVREFCQQDIVKQYPQLVEIDGDAITPENWQEWLAAKVQKYGEYLPVSPLSAKKEAGGIPSCSGN